MALQFQNRIRMELSSIPGRGTGGNSCVRRFRLIPEEGIAGGAGAAGRLRFKTKHPSIYAQTGFQEGRRCDSRTHSVSDIAMAPMG